MICATVYGVTAEILGLPYPLALAVIAGFLDLIPNIGAMIAGIIIGIVALSVGLGALIAFAIVIVVYQQIENYILQPTIIGKAAQVSGFTVLASVLAFGGALRAHRRDHRRADRGRDPDRRRRAHRRPKGSHRRRGRRGAAAGLGLAQPSTQLDYGQDVVVRDPSTRSDPAGARSPSARARARRRACTGSSSRRR